MSDYVIYLSLSLAALSFLFFIFWNIFELCSRRKAKRPEPQARALPDVFEGGAKLAEAFAKGGLPVMCIVSAIIFLLIAAVAAKVGN